MNGIEADGIEADGTWAWGPWEEASGVVGVEDGKKEFEAVIKVALWKLNQEGDPMN